MFPVSFLALNISIHNGDRVLNVSFPPEVRAQYKTGCVGDHLECIIVIVKRPVNCE